MSIFFMILYLLVSVNGIPNRTCNRIKIGEKFYEREIIWGQKNKGRPYNLNIHKSSNILFFSYSVNSLISFVDVDFQMSYVDLDSKESQIIAGIRGGFAVAVNQNTDDIYLGGSEGIFKYNMETKLADFYKEKGTNIWSLFYNKNLFYISYPDQRLHIEVDDKFARVKEFADFEIDQFHVNNEGLIFFANKSGLYSYDNLKMTVNIVNELITVRQLAEDSEGKLYVCTNFGMYTVSNDTIELKKVTDLRNVHGLAFDKDNNFVISDEMHVIKLKQSEKGCLADNEIHKW